LRADYAEAWNNKGNALARLGQDGDVLECYEKAIELRPDFPEAWYNKANILAQTPDRREEALQAYDDAITSRSHYLEAWNNKAVVLTMLARHDDALEAGDIAIDIDPANPYAWDTKSWSLIVMERYDEALEASEESLRLKPNDHPEAWENKGLALSKLEGRSGEAVEWLCQAWLLRERLPDGGQLVANTLRDLGYEPGVCE
jgi:tetratricopeptide (TPR) repeat protein